MANVMSLPSLPATTSDDPDTDLTVPTADIALALDCAWRPTCAAHNANTERATTNNRFICSSSENAVTILNEMPPKPSGRSVHAVMHALARAIDHMELPAVEKIAEDSQEDPFEVLISTMLSAQTRDPVTAAASARLFKVARTPRTLARLPVKRIERLI